MTTGRVTVDGVRNDPVHPDDVAALLRPLVDLIGLDLGDVVAIRVDKKAVRARVAVRNKRGRRLVDSWANVVVRIEDVRYDEEA